MSGQHNTWSGEFTLDEAPVRGENDPQNEAIKIPVEISYMDNSGNVADTYTVSGQGTELEFCEQDCVCFPEDISGEWRLAQKAGAYGVGRAEGSIGDWSSTDFTLTERDCQFDDTYTFSPLILIFQRMVILPKTWVTLLGMKPGSQHLTRWC